MSVLNEGIAEEIDPIKQWKAVVAKGSNFTYEDIDQAVLESATLLGLGNLYEGLFTIGEMTQKRGLLLAIHESTRRVFRIKFGAEELVLPNTRPDYGRHIWFGESVVFYTTDQARRLVVGGQSALDIASSRSIGAPAQVVKARNGQYYPGTLRDTVLYR